MDAMKDWVRGLVVLVLLASCLELLLPMGNMKKYVKLTMGLLIVLATLKPVLAVLGQPVSAINLDFLDQKPGQSLPTLNQIMADATRLQQQNQSLASDEVRLALAAEAARAARSVAGVADARATVDLREQGREVKIQIVSVTIVPGQLGGVAPVQPVAPVGGAGGSAVTGGRPVSSSLTEAEKRLTDAVRQEVATRLGLRPDPDVVRIVVERGSDLQRR